MTRMRIAVGCGVLASIAGVLFSGAALAQRPQVPHIERLKPLFLTTDVVRDGRAQAVLIKPASGCYDAAARRIVDACRELTGVKLPVYDDFSPAAQLPLNGNVITLGNRSTNALISRLYDRHDTLLDLRYPGKDGYVVRTLHNPFGGGVNVVFAGGSDAAGVDAAADVLIAAMRKARQGREITLSRLAEIHLASGVQIPKTAREAEIWEASGGYRSSGYFGWNSLSKLMALYYMTGDPAYAKEFLRLAFSDAPAQREIARSDGERIEDKEHPLSGPYHYNAHLMILYWDLIEESPAFTDADRLRVTQAFAEQLNHWAAEWVYAAHTSRPPAMVGSRHGQWAAVSLYCLARYFQTHYPDPVWQDSLDAGRRHFASLHDYAWVAGENDNLFWYCTSVAPILTYMVLTGDRVPLESGSLGTLLRGQEILLSGRRVDENLRYVALDYLHKAAYITGDGRWLNYRDRTGMDTHVFRLGQSFWPDEPLKPVPPSGLIGKWTVHRLSEPKWAARQSGLPLGESFEFASFRSEPDEGGDFTLLDGFNGASRNPYHTFAVLNLRLDGFPLLHGYANQVVTRVDGLMEPKVAMDAALKRADVIGSSAVAVGEVPNLPFAGWRRTLLERTGRYALLVDELTYRQESRNAEAIFSWQTAGRTRSNEPGRLIFDAAREQDGRRLSARGSVLMCDPLETATSGSTATMRWLGPTEMGGRKVFFSLVGVQPGDSRPTLACYRLSEHAAALALPEPAEISYDADGERQAEVTLVAANHALALGATRLGSLIEADHPVDLDWDFDQGILHLVAIEPTTVRLRIDRDATGSASVEDMVTVKLAAGQHRLDDATPTADALAALRSRLELQLDAARQARTTAAVVASSTAEANVPSWTSEATASVGSEVTALEIVPADDGPLVAAAEGSTIHLISLDGRETAQFAADGPVRLLRWWPEPELLLAGCADEKVIAFDRAGRRRWEFVSEMDPAVARTGKTYWYKSAHDQHGIHGLDVGAFLDGGTQAFVGSACTLEILGPDGKLLHRMPQFWGTVATFCLVDGPDGTKNLLAARHRTESADAAVINSKTLNSRPRGFSSVPPGFTYVGGWMAMNHGHLFYEDLDGDDTREVVSETNGVWNRLGVWTAAGRPLHAVNLGPGRSMLTRTIRDMDVGNLDGNGRKQIVLATSEGMAIVFDGYCNRLWATRLASPANVLGCIDANDGTSGEIVFGCDDGRVRVFDAQGNLLRTGSVKGKPTHLKTPSTTATPWCIFATAEGEIALFAAKPK